MIFWLIQKVMITKQLAMSSVSYFLLKFALRKNEKK